VWGASKASADFLVEYCNVSGSSCDATVVSNTLSTDGSGALSGTLRAPSGLTTGNRAIKITEGTNVSLTQIVVLATASISVSPTAGGSGTVTNVTGSNFNPLAATTAYSTYQSGPPFATTGDANSSLGNASSTGTISGTRLITAQTTIGVVAFQGTAGPPNATNPAAFAAFTVNQDQCVAYTGDSTGGAGCATRQNVNVSVLQGNLTQRVYVNSTAATGTGVATSSATTPVVGTSNVNTDNTTVNLGTLTTPLAPVVIAGTLNDITVSDNRGGTNGWSLTATGTSFTGVPSGTIAASNLTATPACAAATNSTAWDYTAVGKTAISGFDDTLNAGGVTAGSAAQAFGSTVNLCTKNTTPNVTTGSTGGVYNVTSSLALTVPAFQQAARYTAVVTVTLA
jgi:hypothetical protein